MKQQQQQGKEMLMIRTMTTTMVAVMGFKLLFTSFNAKSCPVLIPCCISKQ